MSQEQRPYGGGSIPDHYARYLVPLLFEDYAADLASRLGVPAGAAVLETACGTGVVTRHLRARLGAGGRLVVTDLAPAMLDTARRSVGNGAGLEYRTADAANLPFADGSFDAVVCQYAVMLVPDPWAAMREAARVLRPGGRFVFNIWDRLDRNVFSRAVHEAVAALYEADPPRFLEVPFAYHDLTVIADGLQAAGFRSIEILVSPGTSRAPRPRDVALGLVGGTPLATQVTERGTPSLEEAIQAAERAIAREFGEGPVSAPMQGFQIVASSQV